ncbi:hypothetical protein [Candidatus Sneabacter namystus]|uniref:Uncharacterized protein n=1 Tax=Candidatus Sneabacter namystus TaxID=2601646 RepID=A0A5C0UHW8_9RICK|nr:hypothetical protein [Candidatus Sneabacter namystus]QEK39785.1 hypothetical protein FZC37_02515 [Candidatus Sneabacter namystus]
MTYNHFYTQNNIEDMLTHTNIAGTEERGHARERHGAGADIDGRNVAERDELSSKFLQNDGQGVILQKVMNALCNVQRRGRACIDNLGVGAITKIFFTAYIGTAGSEGIEAIENNDTLHVTLPNLGWNPRIYAEIAYHTGPIGKDKVAQEITSKFTKMSEIRGQQAYHPLNKRQKVEVSAERCGVYRLFSEDINNYDNDTVVSNRVHMRNKYFTVRMVKGGIERIGHATLPKAITLWPEMSDIDGIIAEDNRPHILTNLQYDVPPSCCVIL